MGRFIDYNEYIRSDAWIRKRDQRLAIDNYQCKKCGTAKNLIVHHITYKNLGHEDMDDLVTLCWNCHNSVHENDNGNKKQPEINYSRMFFFDRLSFLRILYHNQEVLNLRYADGPERVCAEMFKGNEDGDWCEITARVLFDAIDADGQGIDETDFKKQLQDNIDSVGYEYICHEVIDKANPFTEHGADEDWILTNIIRTLKLRMLNKKLEELSVEGIGGKYTGEEYVETMQKLIIEKRSLPFLKVKYWGLGG